MAFHSHLVAVEQLDPHLGVGGGAADTDVDGLTGMGGFQVGVDPSQCRVRHLVGPAAEHVELLGGDGEGVVEALEFDIVLTRLQLLRAGIEGCFVVEGDHVLIDEGLVLEAIGLGLEAIGREPLFDLGVAEQLPVEVDTAAHRIEIVDLRVVVEAIDLAFHAALGGFPTHVGGIDLILAQRVHLHQRGHVGAEGNLVVAGPDQVGVAMRLALGAGGRDFDLVGEHRLLLGLGLERGLQVEGDGELAVLVGTALAEVDLLILHVGVPPPPAAPGEVGLTGDTIAVLHVVEGEAGQGIDAAMEGDRLVELVLFLDPLEVQLEGGTFVFFHTEGTASVVGPERKHPVEAVGGDDEGAAEAAVVIGGEGGPGDFLVVGVSHDHGLGGVGNRRLGVGIGGVEGEDPLEIHRLTRTIDRTVGEQRGDLVLVSLALQRDVHAVDRKQQVVAFAQADIELVGDTEVLVDHHHAVGARSQGLEDLPFVFPFLIVVKTLRDLHLDAAFGMAGLAVHRHEVHVVLLGIFDEAQSGDLELHRVGAFEVHLVLVACTDHQEIDARFELGQREEAVVHPEVGLRGDRDQGLGHLLL